MITSRIIVDRSVHDDVVDRFLEIVKQLAIGDPADPHTAIGPIINEKQLESIQDKVSPIC